MTPQQIQAVREAGKVLVSTVKEMGAGGAPAGPMYAALMSKLSLNQFNTMMDTLVKHGYLRQEGHVYYFVKDL